MKTTAFEQIKMSLQRTKGYTANKMSKLADATVAAIEELDERKANAEEITQKIDTTIQNGTDIKNLIGQTENTGGTTTAGTIMAKLNKLLTDWTNSRATKIDTINTNVSNLNTRLTSTRASRLDNIGTTSDTDGSATAGTLMAKVNALLGLGGSSGLKVKSIQHGYADKLTTSTPTGNGFDTNKNRKVNISTVNSSKAILLIFNEITSPYSLSSSYPLNKVPILYSTYLLQPYYAITTSNYRYSGFSYYVIEFY